MTFRADPGEVRRALPEDNRTNRRSHAFRCQVFSQIYLLDQGPTVGFQVKPNVQEHFSRDGEDWQEGSLIELNKAICIIWPNIFSMIWPKLFLYEMTRYMYIMLCDALSHVLPWKGSVVDFQGKPNIQEHFPRDGENWQEGSLLELNKAFSNVWLDIFAS